MCRRRSAPPAPAATPGRRRPGDRPAPRQLLVGDQLRLDDDPRLVVDGLDLVGDGGDRPLGEGHQPGGAHPDGRAGRGGPLAVAAQHAGAEVEDAFVGAQPAVAQVEGFVVDEQAEDLAVGDVDDGLPGLGVAVAGLRVRQRMEFVDAVEVGAGHSVRFALVEVAAPADVSVGEGEQGLALRQDVEVQAPFAQRPRFDAVRPVCDHAQSPRSVRSATTVSAPWARRAAAWPTRSRPTT